MTAPDGNSRELARICREALNQELYGGDAPHDSNALSEVWPTAAGAGFTIQRHGRTYGVAVAPVEDITALIQPLGWEEETTEP